MTDVRNQLDTVLLAQQMRASFGEVGARVIATLEARVCSLETSNGKRATETLALDQKLSARVDAAHDHIASIEQSIAALQRKSEAPLANEHGSGGIFDRLSKLSNTMTFLCMQLDFNALRGPRTVAARLSALEKAERERPTAPSERTDSFEGLKCSLLGARTELEELRRAKEPTVQLRRDVDLLARAAYSALLDLPLGSRRKTLFDALRPFATEYGFALPPPEGP